MEASVEGTTAWAGCVVENPAYISTGEVTFHFVASGSESVTASYNVGGYQTYAQVQGVELKAGTEYSVYASCKATNGESVVSNTTTIQTESAKASESWLELPALRSDGRYPNAAEYKVYSGGEVNYTTYYDRSTYTSMWVAYPLESKHMGSYERPDKWSFNPLLSTSYQVNLCDHSYSSSYSRGHLIPNASRNGIKDMQLQTFYVTNSVPQIQDNFNGGIWMYLEAAIQSIAESEKIYVVTGVAFQKEGETKSISYTTAKDDTKRVPVPNYFYKVVLKVNTNSSGVVTSASTIGFWFDHKTYTDSYTNYAVSVDQIEAWTGFDFFANLPDAVERSAESNTSWSSFSSF
ncbi:MAG: DNA/RNA non-specific endonuclease [Alistipes sp.]|nr:DNA/RNA non-specific endonuclease [Alistipes sp.]